MSLAAALFLIAQSAAPAVADAPIAAAQVQASATILSPVSVRLSDDGEVMVDAAAGVSQAQHSRDAAGTLWIEFS